VGTGLPEAHHMGCQPAGGLAPAEAGGDRTRGGGTDLGPGQAEGHEGCTQVEHSLWPAQWGPD